MKKIVLFVMIITAISGCLIPMVFLPTNVDPEVGYYAGEIGFRVDQNANSGRKYIVFSTDGYHSMRIFIFRGVFYKRWGDYPGGTHCPTDAYIISGHFISPTEAEGQIRYGSDCQFGWPQKFTLQLQNP